jgi:hypothetical protein
MSKRKPAAQRGRIELQAPVKWIARLDAAAKAKMLSRSAFIRLACDAMMREEQKGQ